MEKREADISSDSTLKYMDSKSIKETCKGDGMYETEELNEVLYLQMKGFSNIGGLAPYHNLKCLFLNNNCIKKIENLDGLPNLKSLYLHNNDISRIENLNCENLLVLNLSNNKIKKIENLKHLKFLQAFYISNNLIENVSDIKELVELKNLSHIDISSNKLKIGSDSTELEIGSLFENKNRITNCEKESKENKENKKNKDTNNVKDCTLVQNVENVNEENVELTEGRHDEKDKASLESENERQFNSFLRFYENFKKDINKEDVNKVYFYENQENMNHFTKKNFRYLCEFIILLKNIKKLKTLIIKNNPFTREFRYLTKYLIANIPCLLFLDDKKVKKEDVVSCRVFLRLGIDKEKEIKTLFEQKKLDKYRDLTEKFHSFLMDAGKICAAKPE